MIPNPHPSRTLARLHDTLLQKLLSGEIAISHDFTPRIEFLRRYA